jgi:hypothetical protein
MSAKPQLVWINDMGDPRAKRDASTRSLIKQHVMKSIGKSRRKVKERDLSTRSRALSSGRESSCNTPSEVTDDSVRSLSSTVQESDLVADVIHYSLKSDATRPSLFSRSIATCLDVAAPAC